MGKVEYIRLVMLRDDLAGIPEYPLPDGFSMRRFGDGDRATWLRIEKAAEPYVNISDKTFDREFSGDLPAMGRRSRFLVAPDGRDIGTITCWYDRSYAGKRWGRIHWVAIVPEFQGRGLAKCMMTAAMKHLRSLGHRRGILETQTPRIAAIKVYLDFGFKPDMTAKDAHRAWTLLREKLSHPALDGALR